MNKNKKGIISLEACITVLAFLILMLLLSSLFVMFMAQNTVAHVLLQTSESLAIDNYAATNIGNGGTDSVSDLVMSAINLVENLIGYKGNNPNFATNDGFDPEYFPQDDKSYDPKKETISAKENRLKNEKVAGMVKTRFVGYLANGDTSAADELLKMMNVKDGLDGLDFSGSNISGNDLNVVVNYTLVYDFNIWKSKLNEVEVEQTACSKLWK